MASKRVNVKAILADADLRRKLMVSTIQATQAREGIETSPAQADRAYYVVTQAERTAFFELERFKGGKKGEQDKRHEMFVRSLRGEASEVRQEVARRDFAAIDGSPLAYERVGLIAHLFRENKSLAAATEAIEQGVASVNIERYVRCYWEIAAERVAGTADERSSAKPWARFAKGGDFARFYSDVHLLMFVERDWETMRVEVNERYPYLKGNASLVIHPDNHYFQEGLTWPLRTQRGFNVRHLPEGCVFGHKGPGIFPRSASETWLLLGIANSQLAEFILQGLTSFGSWEVGAIRRLPCPRATKEQRERISRLARGIHDSKRDWDRGNEASTSFDKPWLVSAAAVARTLGEGLDQLAHCEAKTEAEVRASYAELNQEVFRLYGFSEASRNAVEAGIGVRPPEVLWVDMEGKTKEQKRVEHVWRLLSFAVKRVVESDDDGIVPFNRSTGETPLSERVRQELATLFPAHDESQLEAEIINELKRSVKGYRKCASLDDWLANAYFEYHAGLYKSRPIYWHVASVQGTSPFAFGALVHYHRFDKNRMAKLRASYVRDTIEELRREAGLADKAGRTGDRVELQAKLEEVQALDKKLQLIQEGHHEGAEGSDRDFRILTPWKEPAKRPNGWSPDLDDGVKVNIAPLDRAGILRASGVAR
jgi:hypothetical protein